MAGPMDAGDAAALIRRLRAQRELRVELAPPSGGRPAKAVLFRRPAETGFADLIRTEGGQRTMLVGLDHVQRCAVGWQGITEADLLGAAIGVNDEVAFDAAVWAEVVADRIDWLQLCAQGILDAITQHLQRQADAAKNSAATSTPGQQSA